MNSFKAMEQQMAELDDSEEAILNDAAFELARQWGYSEPTRDILELADLSLRVQAMRSGEALEQLGLLSKEDIDALESQKPRDTKILAHIAKAKPKLNASVEQVQALRNGYPYYSSLSSMKLHPSMRVRTIHSRCEEMSAVILQIDDFTPVLVFSKYDSLTKYAGQGTIERASCPIREYFKIEVGTNVRDLAMGVGTLAEVSSLLSREDSKPDDIKQDLTAKRANQFDAQKAADPIERLFCRIMDLAIAAEATDIEIEPDTMVGTSDCLMRKDNDLRLMPIGSLKEKSATELVNFLMSRSGANPEGGRVFTPRDGEMYYHTDKSEAFLRFSFIPLNVSGSDFISVSIRIFNDKGVRLTLKTQNLAEIPTRALKNAAIANNGLILLVGATNTGKSSTIGATLGENVTYYGRKKKRVSIEQPVERRIPGVIQINVPSEIKNKNGELVDGFAMALRAAKRHDPDVIWIGEIRDLVTANTAVDAAVSGHLVFSTIHAESCYGGYETLSKFAHEDKRFQLIDSLLLIVAQRLEKKLCEHCSTPGAPTDEQIERFKRKKRTLGLKDIEPPSTISHKNKSGCEKCDFEGTKGLLPVNEVLEVTAEVKSAMYDMLHGVNRRDDIQSMCEQSMFEACLTLVKNHHLDFDDILI